MGNNDIALLCMLHPASPEKQKRILSLLQNGAREYYRQPSAKCTTWSYFTPFPPPKKADAPLVIGGMEIYTEKNALQKQIDDPVFFQAFHETAKKEALYAKDEELVAWYLTAGFVAREQHAKPFGGNLISLSRFTGDREAILKTLSGFIPFVRDQEPDVLTYAVFTRPKAPKDLLLFVRYKDSKAMKSHSNAPEHVDVIKKIMKHVEGGPSNQSTTVWQEIEDSFVSTVEGGPTDSSKL